MSDKERIPRAVHIPWFAVALASVIACEVAYPEGPGYSHPIRVVALVALSAWCWCSRWMR